MTEQVKRQTETILRRFPTLASETVRSAGDALRGVMVLPGCARPSAVGVPPRWTHNPYNHNEYTFHLNRMNHWLPLLRAFALTGDATYARKVTDELSDWLAACPRPPLGAAEAFSGLSPWRSLEAGVRMHKTWYFVPQFLSGVPCFERVRGAFYDSVRQHAEVLSTICPQLWPEADHNHYLMEMLGLLAASELLGDGDYRAQAVRELERCAQSQITVEGGQIEGCPSYHNGCVGWFTRALTLDSGFSEDYKTRVRRMLDYSVYTCRPSGTTVPWGDSTAKRGALRSAVLGYLAFGDAGRLNLLKGFAGEEAVRDVICSMAWDVPDVEGLFSALSGMAAPLPSAAHFKALKQAVLRTGWNRNALSVFFACRTPVQNAHAHIDPMGFDFTAYGKPMVVDPGKFSYKEGDARYRFKSAAYHNTATVDGRDHFQYRSSWSYGPQGEGEITAFSADSVTARHDCFAPVIHTRRLTLKENRLVVEDVFTGCSADTVIRIFFHLDEPDVRFAPGGGVAFSVSDGPTVMVCYDRGLSAELLPGEVSDVNDTARPSKRLRLTSAHGAGERRFETVLVPCRAKGGANA